MKYIIWYTAGRVQTGTEEQYEVKDYTVSISKLRYPANHEELARLICKWMNEKEQQ